MKHEQDAMIERVAETLRTPERVDASFDARVMAAVRALPAPRRRLSLWQWLVQPKLMPVSPIGGLAFGGAVAALLIVAAVRGGGPGRATVDQSPALVHAGDRPGAGILTPVAATDGIQPVQFVLAAPSAGRVALVGDFNDWQIDSTMLRRVAGGLWTVTVPLPPGRYTYTFVVDGETWVADPNAAAAPRDEFFGRPSSVVTVGGVAR